MTAPVGWVLFVVVPMVLFTAIALRYAHSSSQVADRWFVPAVLLLNTWFYFGINYAFFHFPWPWAEWTGRTPSGILFAICAMGLTLAALLPWKASVPSHQTTDAASELDPQRPVGSTTG